MRMQAQELSTIPAEQKAYELSVLWKEMSYNFGNIDNCPGLDIDSLYRAFLPKVTETKDDFEYWKMLQRFIRMTLNTGKCFSGLWLASTTI